MGIARILIRLISLPTMHATASAELMKQRMALFSNLVWDATTQYNQHPTRSVDVEALMLPLQEVFAGGGFDAATHWFRAYLDLLRLCFHRDQYVNVMRVSDRNASLATTLKNSTAALAGDADADKLRLLHPRDKTLVPVSAVPLIPLPEDLETAAGDKDDVTLLLLRGAARAALGTERAPHIFDGAQLHVPERTHPEDKHATDDALYHSEASAFAPFKTDSNSTSHFVVVLRDDVAYLRPVRHLREMHRDHEHRAPDVTQYVMWDEAAPPTDATNGKKHRAEAT